MKVRLHTSNQPIQRLEKYLLPQNYMYKLQQDAELLCSSFYPFYSQCSQMRRLRSVHPGPLRAEGPGQELARKMPQVHKLQRDAQREVLHQAQRRLLQRGLLQVSV